MKMQDPPGSRRIIPCSFAGTIAMLANTDMTGCALTTDRHRTAAPVEPGRQHFPDRGVDGAVADLFHTRQTHRGRCRLVKDDGGRSRSGISRGGRKDEV